MKIITQRCEECGTVIAANELERRRVMKCPRMGCEEVLRFADLPTEERNHFLENRDEYQI